MFNGWELYTALEIDGIRILDSTGIDASKMDLVTKTTSALTYISNVSKIANFIEQSVIFTHDYSYNNEEFNNLFDIVKTIDGKSIYTEKEITSNASCNIVADDGAKNIELIENSSEPTIAKISEVTQETIKCFGVSLKLPVKNISLTNITPKVCNTENKVKKGDIVHVELIPSKGFECKFEYNKP